MVKINRTISIEFEVDQKLKNTVNASGLIEELLMGHFSQSPKFLESKLKVQVANYQQKKKELEKERIELEALGDRILLKKRKRS
jgi:hypothetical protein